MMLERMLKITIIQLGSKSISKYKIITYNLNFFRFGTSSRKELKRNDWPGPGKYELPTYTEDGR